VHINQHHRHHQLYRSQQLQQQQQQREEDPAALSEPGLAGRASHTVQASSDLSISLFRAPAVPPVDCLQLCRMLDNQSRRARPVPLTSPVAASLLSRQADGREERKKMAAGCDSFYALINISLEIKALTNDMRASS